MPRLTPAELNFWFSEARSCEERQRIELIQRNNYPFLINYYEGLDKDNQKSDSLHVNTQRKLAIINEYFPNTNSLISEIMYQNPDIIAEAAKPQAEAGEGLMKAALQYSFEKTDALIENRVALFDMFYAGYCAVEIDHMAKDTVKNQKSLLPSEDEMEKRVKGVIGRVKDKFSKKAKDEEQAEANFAKKQPSPEEAYADVEQTYIRRWDPLDVPLDWRARRIKDRRYNLKKLWYSKAEFDAKYPDFTKKVFPTEGDNILYSRHSGQEHSRKILVYEFQIKEKNNVFWNLQITPSLTTEELDIFKRPYTTNGFNMKIGTLHKYGKLYPIAIAQINKMMSDEMNEYVRFMKSVAERNIPKRIIDKKKIKTDGKEALNSKVINDLVEVEGNVEGVVKEAPHTSISLENKELLSLFQDQKNKLWNVSETRVGGKQVPKFAKELEIQESGFQGQQIDIQEGLRHLIKSELEVVKDIIATFWDFPVFLKITGGEKPEWYQPQMVQDANNPNQMIVENPLTDQLTGDYSIKVDISSALRPNKERKRAETIQFLQMLLTPGVATFLQMNGKTLNFEEVAKVSKDFGFSPEVLFIDAPMPAIGPPGAGGMPTV